MVIPYDPRVLMRVEFAEATRWAFSYVNDSYISNLVLRFDPIEIVHAAFHFALIRIGKEQFIEGLPKCGMSY